MFSGGSADVIHIKNFLIGAQREKMAGDRCTKLLSSLSGSTVIFHYALTH